MMKSWLAPAEPLHIAGPINFVGTQGLGVYLITTPAGHILLGGGMPGSVATIEASIRKLGYKPEDIKILLSNHAHMDHVGTLADFKKLTGATVTTMDRDVDLLASGGKIDYLFAKNPKLHFPPVTANRVLKDGDIVEVGGVKVTARRTAGHTPGCTTFEATVEEGGRSYNVVFPDGTSVNEGTRFVNNPSYPGILEDYRRTFSTLQSLKPDIFLTYHVDEFNLAAKRERAATEGVRAFVDPEGYKRFIAERKAKFERLVGEEKTTGTAWAVPTTRLSWCRSDGSFAMR
jgi:metallo-beta-lactamase class B